MKYTSPAGGFHSLMQLSGRLSILRILLAIALIPLMQLRRFVAAVLLTLSLALDLSASALSRHFDMCSDAGILLETLADLLVPAALLIALLPRFADLRFAAWMLPLRAVASLLRCRSSGPCSVAGKALARLGCALMLAFILCPGMSAAAERVLAVLEAALLLGATLPDALPLFGRAH